MGFRDASCPVHACLLRKSLYGLKKAPWACSEFAMKDLGTLIYFIGIGVTHHPIGFFRSQKKYAIEILDRVGISSYKPVRTPVVTTSKLSVESGAPYGNPTLYRCLVDALQYLIFTRPDIFYAVQQICLFIHALWFERMMRTRLVFLTPFSLPRFIVIFLVAILFLGPSNVNSHSQILVLKLMSIVVLLTLYQRLDGCITY
ncbi:uncharacterized mitochondrial protein AtMg00810-like [Amaranthus tricolor]|uniref:uncharacterized mitochondrial protein AtMg00810-like n=1 Tax=Amaranthus tricolor TaxID=29722 RepID=UPI00258F9CD7|nr:uncharacterized mitochondrial protein AtMg00810-like [Amaranthus tricolor]